MPVLYLVLFLIFLLSACVSAPAQPVCPVLIPYSHEDQAALGEELRVHPELSEIPKYLADYVGLRDQVRACQKK